jgi:hypothetical protein
MKCKGCGKEFGNEQEGQIDLCQSCWDELCDLQCWEQVSAVAEGAD